MMAESADNDSRSSEHHSRQSPSSGFNEEYESLSDHDGVGPNVNPFAVGGSRSRRPLVETVSSPQRSSSSSSSSSSSVTVDSSSRKITGTMSPTFDDPMATPTAVETGISNSSSTPSQQQQTQSQRPLHSMLDDADEEEDPSSRMGLVLPDVRMTQNTTTGGMAGFLEMEAEPTRRPVLQQQRQHVHQQAQQILEDQEDLIDFTQADEPIQTSSGLYLTHRRSSAENRAKSNYANNNTRGHSEFPASYRPSPNRFEVEQTNIWGSSSTSHMYGGFGGKAPASLTQARRMLSMAKLWVLFAACVLLLGTAVLVHAFRHEDAGVTKQQKQQQQDNQIISTTEQEGDAPQQILLLPLNNAAELARQQREFEEAERTTEQRGNRRLLSHTPQQQQQQQQQQHHHFGDGLRQEFEDWITKHEKVYASMEEKEHRFGIWRNNHFRTMEKNEKHGNCRLMNKPVFGSNHLKDLTTEEFQVQFLTGYNGVNADGHEIQTGRKRNLKAENVRPVMHRDLKVTRHHSVHQRLLEEWKIAGYALSSSSCTWYDLSCWMRVIFQEYLYLGIGTMEPIYDADAYPTALDWRDLGAVTDVRKQGDCGACWAITAVETVESAYFIGTGSLLSLSESEVISCTDSCNMCYGGWPQDGYDYVMEHNGVQLAYDWSYDGDTHLAVTQELESADGELDSDLFASFINENCPASQGSGDNNGGDGGDRYGNIKGYGYATERCVCYSDGSGCDCDNQSESMAVRNVASYGPATVCLDASTWQDYEGGILTSSSGCSAEFLAMNHCVQVVGYAYTDGNDRDDENNSGSGSGSGDSGSGDDGNRQGYWIVRNQWSSYWGMSGYAYVAMGDNTCGILNDMTQAYM